jgi:hypothetical protein
MNFRLLKTSALALASIAGATALSATPAAAAPMATFTYNKASSGPSCNCTNASNATIANYMQSVLQSIGFTSATVTVSGAIGQMGDPEYNSNPDSYTGDGHVVGPNTTHPLTLGNTEGSYLASTGPSTPTPGNKDKSKWDAGGGLSGATGTLNTANDGYLKNCTAIDSGCTQQPDIFMQFSNLVMNGYNYEIASISFDFEIFPDGTCPTVTPASSCGGVGGAGGFKNLPDLKLFTGDNVAGAQSGYDLHSPDWYGVTPGASSSTYTSSNTGGVGGTGTAETAPQRLDVSGPISISYANVTSLDFMDWPETIGIDNLVVTFRKTPEPATILVLAFGVLGLAGMTRFRRAQRGSLGT